MAKMMQRIMRTSPLDLVIVTQKDYMDSFKSVQGKIDSVSKALLKWSYIEPNPGIAQAFSCWADLDYAYGQLIVQVCEKGVQYRQVFKDIRDQGVEWNKVKQEKNKATNDVASALRKVENLRKSKKVDQPKIDSAEAELQLAKTRDEEMTEVLRVKTKDFEEYKAKTIRSALIQYSNDYLDAISTMQTIFQTKKEIGEAMSETPVYAGQELPNGHSKVEPIFQKLDLELPMRDAAFDRHQINRTASAPPLRQPSPVTQRKTSNLHSMHEQITKHFPAKMQSRGVKRLKRLKKSKDTGVRLMKYRRTYSGFRSDEPSRPASTVVYKTDFSDSDDDDDEYEYPEDPLPVVNKSMTLPANLLQQKEPPTLPSPNHDATKTGPRLPPNAVQVIAAAAPPKLPPHVPLRALSTENDISDGEDDHEYQYPEESFGSSNPSINTAEEEEEYIIPNRESSESAAVPKTTKPEKIENAEHEDGPGAVYFEVEEKNPDQTRLPSGILTSDVCQVNHPSPPEDTCLDDYYGNISPEQATKLGIGVESGMNRNNSQASNASSAVDNARKPAILPKPKPGSKSPQVVQKISSLGQSQEVRSSNEREDDGDVYVLCNISGQQGGTDENCNPEIEIDDGETYDMVCVDGAPAGEIYGNVEFLENAGHMGQSNNQLLGQDASDKGPMPTPRIKKISHTYFNPERKQEPPKKEPPKRQPPRSPLPSRPK